MSRNNFWKTYPIAVFRIFGNDQDQFWKTHPKLRIKDIQILNEFRAKEQTVFWKTHPLTSKHGPWMSFPKIRIAFDSIADKKTGKSIWRFTEHETRMNFSEMGLKTV